MANLVTVEGCVVGEYGKTIQITCLNEKGEVQNISSYDSTKTMYARSPAGNRLINAACSFVTDGTDGKVSFSWATGDLDQSGDWRATLKLTSASATAKSYLFIMHVDEAVA